MGIDISSKLLYGMEYEKLVKNLTDDQIEHLNEDLDFGEIDYASPYYDSPREHWTVGYDLSEWFNLSTVSVFLKDLEDAEIKFKNRFGITGWVLSCTDVY